MCSGFKCTKTSLVVLNIIYIVVSFILIGVAAYGKASSLVTSLPVIGGITACGIFLLLTAILGLVGTFKHHQVLLFFYMVILFLLFIIQFSIACACLAFSEEQQNELAEIGWNQSDNGTRHDVQELFGCCGFSNVTEPDRPSCPQKCCPDDKQGCCESGSLWLSECRCSPCHVALSEVIGSAFRASGGLGLFFSFTEFIGVWLTVRFRNQKDPRANPSNFL
ncbi:tetraspanin-13-like isoform X2 [Artemia franciscana]|uniref:tetraspanin-13-like isoform X2 n=1 Tax=Artemia franciscana TaxID=6661 RepID=UPI0032D9F880